MRAVVTLTARRGLRALPKREICGLGGLVAIGLALSMAGCAMAGEAAVFNVKDYGASGRKSDNAQGALQRAIEACARAGGGTVYLPPGDYTSGTVQLRSHVRVELEGGATLYASRDPGAYAHGGVSSKAALFFGENLENVSIGGRGKVDGQAEYEWRPDDFEKAFDNKTLMLRLGKSIQRPFPKGFPKREVFPHLVWLGRCRDVHIADLNFAGSPSWTMAFYACDGLVLDRLHVATSLKEGVWADGIDLDGCQDVTISNSTIETGDDCIVFISTDAWGPARLCENITVSNCRLSSASAGVKFSEGNRAGIRRVTVNNTVFAGVNRGLVMNITQGGSIEDVVVSDSIIECRRFDWFWAGDGQPFSFRIARTSEINQEPPIPGEAGPGTIRNVAIRNITARGRGSSWIRGHPESWLDGVCLENLRLFVSADPAAPYERAEHALAVAHARNLRARNVEVIWDKPEHKGWKSALHCENVQGFDLDGFAGRAVQADSGEPAVSFKNVADAIVRHSRATGKTKVFLKVAGARSRDIVLQGNDLRHASTACAIEAGLGTNAVRNTDGVLGE